MSYASDGERVTLTLTRDQFDQLLIMLGSSCAAVADDKLRFRHYISLVNKLNEGNPDFRAYVLVPEAKP